MKDCQGYLYSKNAVMEEIEKQKFTDNELQKLIKDIMDYTFTRVYFRHKRGE